MNFQARIDYLSQFVMERRLERFRQILDLRTAYVQLALQDTYHMHNASAVLRSSDAFGMQRVHLIRDKFAKEIDTEIALGAQKWLDIQQHSSNESLFAYAQDQGMSLVATSPHKGAARIETLDLTRPVLIMLGTEREGLTDDAFAKADQTLHIPMYGFTESLNLSVTASLIFHGLRQRLEQSERSYGLVDKEKQRILLDWLRTSVKDSGRLEALQFDE